MINKKEIIKLLDNIADMLEFKGENPFKIKAYRNGGNIIRRLDQDLNEVMKNRELHKINGIGKSLQSIIYEYFETGESSLHKELKKEVPDGIEQLLKIKGLNIKKINFLYNEIGVKNVIDLEQACKENRLALLKGFGEPVQTKILEEIEKFKFNQKFVHLNTAEKFKDEILDKLSSIKFIIKKEVSGELRRGMEIISAIDIIILTSDSKKLIKELKKIFELIVSENKVKIKEYFDIPVTLHLTLSEKKFVKELFITTGSDEFIKILKINIDKIDAENEDKIFSKVNAPYVIPEMREKEYFEVNKKMLQKNSDLKIEDFQGLLHFHTTSSDGRNTLNEMIKAAAKFGFKYAAVTEHSKSAYYANGLKEKDILLQKKELKELSSKNNLVLFQGIESDILQNGDLDYSPDFLNEFDFIIASIHSRFNMNEDEMTNRMLKAIYNPYTDLLAHPSGRMLLSRDPYKFDVKKIIDACAANDVAIEINSNPRRLDIDWRWIFYAREKGCLFSVNPDAHSVEEISLIKYGIKMGRKEGLRSSEVINCFTLDKFKKFLKRKIKRTFINDKV